ncbi:hypothetical protein SAMN02745166_03543 [Prosthecobacter debontii]|uniref:Uncharacterized protein n=1 Tax=Prosthecobacter debontii TaxID=48467 RepID=A0A1T4YK91_9BACT|nr:hypothetical protein SAMN02745166_03543 [Prosthecobacter debontii]
MCLKKSALRNSVRKSDKEMTQDQERTVSSLQERMCFSSISHRFRKARRLTQTQNLLASLNRLEIPPSKMVHLRTRRALAHETPAEAKSVERQGRGIP